MTHAPKFTATRSRRATGPGKGDRRERAILDSAERYLAKHDLQSMTIEAIAEGAGITRPSIYFHFDSKAAIVDALIERASQQMLDPWLALAENPDVSFEDYVDQNTRALFDGWRRHKAVFVAAAAMAAGDADVRVRWQENNKRFFDAMTVVVERNRTAGRLPPGLDAAQTSWALGWMVERTCYMLFTRKHTRAEEERLRRSIIDIILKTFC